MYIIFPTFMSCQNSSDDIKDIIRYILTLFCLKEQIRPLLKLSNLQNCRYVSWSNLPYLELNVNGSFRIFLTKFYGKYEPHCRFSTYGALTYEDQFIQITTLLPSTYLYGFGENTHPSLLHQFEPRNTWPIFTRDKPIGTVSDVKMLLSIMRRQTSLNYSNEHSPDYKNCMWFIL